MTDEEIHTIQAPYMGKIAEREQPLNQLAVEIYDLWNEFLAKIDRSVAPYTITGITHKDRAAYRVTLSIEKGTFDLDTEVFKAEG